MKILAIEDNPKLAARMKQQLRKWYLIETAHSGDKGLELALTRSFDLILLDLGLPDISGLELCKELRKVSRDIPILVITGVDTTESRVQLLESGADDYITKPFELPELRARINALARRRSRSKQVPEIIIGDLVINPEKRSVHRAGVPIQLRRKEFDILEYLARNPGRILSRHNIIDHAWASTSTSWTGSVDVHIKQLRDKIDRPFSYPLIKTSYGLGYTVDIPEDIKKRKENTHE